MMIKWPSVYPKSAIRKALICDLRFAFVIFCVICVVFNFFFLAKMGKTKIIYFVRFKIAATFHIFTFADVLFQPLIPLIINK